MFCNMELSKKQCQFIQFSGAIVLIIIIALAIDLTKSGGSHHTPALKLVIVVTRHGTRGPMEAYPNDPYKSDKYWPDGHEALTSIGKIQLYNIGVTLRQLYDGFLNTHYSPSEFRAYSTLIERTLQSAESLLAGLYPPKDYQQWNANIDWQPVPVYPNNLDKQNLPSHPEECTRFWKLQNDSILLAEDNSNETRKIIQVININSGLNITSAADLTPIWDSLSCEVTRHGVRTPLFGYPNDPYKSGKYWPDGNGALISVGKKQMYNVGTTLRQLYDGFLDPHYLSSEFRAYSTLIERTLQSAESLLAGLYPPKDYQQWNENIDWQPIPVFPNYLDKQSVASHPQECTRYWKLQNDSQKLNEDNSDETKKIIKYVNDKSGLNITSSKEIYLIWDTLSCEYYNGMKLPEWTKAVFPSPLESIWSKQIHGYLTRYEVLVRLVAGPMMQSFIDSMKLKLNDTQNKERRMLYYSSHDHTLQTLLSALGFVDAPLVKFAHTMLLELHSHPMLPSGHEVKFFQIDGTTNDRSPRLYNIPNCTTPCDFYQFVEVTKKYYDDLNWTKECQL